MESRLTLMRYAALTPRNNPASKGSKTNSIEVSGAEKPEFERNPVTQVRTKSGSAFRFMAQ